MTPPEPAGDDRGAAPRQQLPDLLGPLEDAMRLRPAGIAVADDSHERRPWHRGSISHPGSSSEREGCQRLISGRPGAEVAAHQAQLVDGEGAVRRRCGRRLDPAAQVNPPRRARARVTCGRYGSVWGSCRDPARSAASAGGPPSGSPTPYHSTRRAPRPSEGAQASGRQRVIGAMLGGRVPRSSASISATRSASTGPRKASVRWSASGVAQRSPSVRGSARHSAIAPARAARSASSSGTPRSSATPRSSVRQARVHDRQQLVERRDHRHALGHASAG